MIRKNALLAVVAMLFATLCLGNSFALTISDVSVSNLAFSSATISWITTGPDAETTGEVHWGESGGPLSNTAQDTRVDDTHYVTITGLTAERGYDFEVVSGGVTDGPHSFTTLKDPGLPPIEGPTVGGFVKTIEDLPAPGTIMFATVIRGAEESYPLSMLVTSGGGIWTISLKSAKNQNGDFLGTVDTDTVRIFAQGAAEGTVQAESVIGNLPLEQGIYFFGDIMLPVEFSLVSAVLVDNGVSIQWRTESEINNLGFDVYRSESPDGKFVKVNPAYIKGAGTDATPHDYKFVDESAVVGKTYYYYIEAISFSGERDRSQIIKVIIDVSGKFKVTDLMKPATFALLQNFPNPFNPETWIPFHLGNDADVTIRIFDIRGQEIRTIHLGQKPAGYYDTKGKAVLWDGRDSYGQEVPSGIYFYSLTAGKFHATKKLTIIK
jgi:hypothetical protein